MSREIIAVYQDCVLCGEKGRQKIAEYAKEGITIRKVGFTTEEGEELIHKAVFEYGVKQMPFYVEGDIMATNLETLINGPKEPKIVKKVRKKAVLESNSKITDEENGKWG